MVLSCSLTIILHIRIAIMINIYNFADNTVGGKMNFLMRPSHTAHVDERPVNEIPKGAQHSTKPSTTLEGLIAEESFSDYGMDEVGSENGSVSGLSSRRDSAVQDNLSDVTEEEGWITIPYGTPSLF